MLEYRECDHTAVVCGRRITFANVEFPADEPPPQIVIAGHRYVLDDDDEEDGA